MRFPALPLPLPLWVARGMLGARRRVLDLADTAVPGEAALFLDVVFGLQKTKIAGVLVSSGLADALGKDSRDPVELAHELGLDPDVTIRIVNGAIAVAADATGPCGPCTHDQGRCAAVPRTP